MISLQSVWRGYLVRSRIADRNVIKARQRIESANSEATDAKKLCNRTASALSYLLSCKYLTTVYDALKNLGMLTDFVTNKRIQFTFDTKAHTTYSTIYEITAASRLLC